jgi:hypothetical protein
MQLSLCLSYPECPKVCKFRETRYCRPDGFWKYIHITLIFAPGKCSGVPKATDRYPVITELTDNLVVNKSIQKKWNYWFKMNKFVNDRLPWNNLEISKNNRTISFRWLRNTGFK